MTDRLYYHDSFLYSFEAQVLESVEQDGKYAIKLDRTAFYPTSGGQVHDTGTVIADNREVPVTEVTCNEEDGTILHFIAEPIEQGTRIRGLIDASRRRDHFQQHSGQHVLSAAFVRLFDAPTVSFHMGSEGCTIDLAVKSLTAEQIERAERLANEIVTEDRPVMIRFVSLDKARKLDLRKLPPKQTGDLRLIDITDFDLTACGGTHVRATGQIGAILVRKVENVKQGVRVEFVCGLRAVSAARRDYTTLTETAGLLSTHIYELPQQVHKTIQESKLAAKAEQKLLAELAEFYAERLLAQLSGTPRVVVRLFPERDASFIKLLAQKLTAAKTDVIALLASGSGQPALVFAQSPGQKFNMGQLLKESMAQLGGRGGGTADLAQGGLPVGALDWKRIENVLLDVATRLKG